jgi:hypothetical protein
MRVEIYFGNEQCVADLPALPRAGEQFTVMKDSSHVHCRVEEVRWKLDVMPEERGELRTLEVHLKPEPKSEVWWG